MNQAVQKSIHTPGKSVSKANSRKAPVRTNDPARTMTNILDVAMVEFAEKGLAGARIDEIAAATRTSKRMIYYYFGSKEGLYTATLEAAYREMRTQEAQLHLDDLPPCRPCGPWWLIPLTIMLKVNRSSVW
jgi:AcrR family transcriptional regulator